MNIYQIDTLSSSTRAAFKEMEYFNVKWSPVNLKVLSPEIALRVIKVSFNVKRKNEPETSTNGIQTFIFEKIGPDWKIVHDQRIMN